MKGELMKDAMYDEFIERVRSESDIVTTISEYISLKKNGKNYWGCCPFHNEKTPSFSVTPDKGFFYCFGCHTGGNVFNFIMKVENVSFFEAAKILANKLNISLPQKEKTPQEIAREREMARLWRVQELAKDFFYACLTKTNYGKHAKEYFLQRGVNDDVINNFKLGFAPEAWDKLSMAFAKRGFSEEILIKSGLAVERKSEGIYDRFRNRVMFPISNERGQVIGFGGRVLDDSQPKYLNSPETAIFNKRNILFGLDIAYSHIKSAGYAIVVEGYMDVITAHSYGVQNVVASLGTSFTIEQCKKLLKYAPEIIFAYDSDSAGQNATMRALSIVRKSGAQVRVISIPDGKDPDEFIRKHGQDAFLDLVKVSLPLIDYQVERAFSENDYSTLEGKVAVVAKIVPVLAVTDNAVEVNAYIARISQKLGIDESAIRSEVRKIIPQNQKDKYVKTGQNIRMNTLVQQVDSAAIGAGRHIIRLVWNDNAIIPYLEAQLTLDEFQNKEHHEIIKFLLESYHAGEDINEVTASLILDEAINTELSHCLLIELEEEDSLRLVDDCIKTIHLAYLKRLYEQHRLKADELERMGDEGFLQELAESQRIKYEINKMHYE